METGRWTGKVMKQVVQGRGGRGEGREEGKGRREGKKGREGK